MVDQLNKSLAYISILSLSRTFKIHQNSLNRGLSEAHILFTIMGGEMDHIVRQLFEAYKLSFHKDELLSEERSYNKAFVNHSIVQQKGDIESFHQSRF